MIGVGDRIGQAFYLGLIRKKQSRKINIATKSTTAAATAILSLVLQFLNRDVLALPLLLLLLLLLEDEDCVLKIAALILDDEL